MFSQHFWKAIEMASGNEINQSKSLLEDDCKDDPARKFFVDIVLCAEQWMSVQNIMQIVEFQCTPITLVGFLSYVSATGWAILKSEEGTSVFLTSDEHSTIEILSVKANPSSMSAFSIA